MFTKKAVIAMALISAAAAAPTDRRQDPCRDAFNQCTAAGYPEVKCSCDLTTCSGEDSARIRDFCATATASLNLPTSTAIPGGCNPAHPGSCPSSYFDTTKTASATATFTSISGIPGGCNPAHPGSCPSSYFDTTKSATATFTSISGIPGGCNPAHPGSCPSSYFDTTKSASATFTSIPGIPGGCNPAHPGSCPSSYFDTTKSATATFTSISGIPGGCNPAHPGSCPSSYFDTTKVASPTATFTSIAGIPGGCNPAHPGSCPSSYFDTTKVASPTATSTSIAGIPGGCNPAHPGSCPSAVPAPPAGGPSPKPVAGKTWSIKNLTRYCGSDNSGCDYNFSIESDDCSEKCTIVRMPGSNAATESWSNVACTAGSDYQVSWGYVTEPKPSFAVITVVDGKELAWFGVSNVNGKDVTPSNPFGSGDFGNLDKSQVYTY